MFQKASEWLHKCRWGLVVAYFLVLITMYLLIWQFADPLGIPDKFNDLPDFMKKRVFFHLTLTLLLGAHITLILDLTFRKGEPTHTQSDSSKYLTQRLVYLLRHIERYPRGSRDKYWPVLDAFHDNRIVVPENISEDPRRGWRTAIHEAFRVLEIQGLVGREGEQVWITDDGRQCIAALRQMDQYYHAFNSQILRLDI